MDNGIQKCVAAQGGGPQWVSEIYYGKDDTTGGNIGDSASAMGRIAWFDAKARKMVGDVASFDSQLQLMQNDLLQYTWMHERYGCDGKMQLNRTAAYFEYPSTIAILLREIRYGIEIGYSKMVIDPMPRAPFHYHIGNVNVDYDPEGMTEIQIPGGQPTMMEYVLHGMRTLTKYSIEVRCTSSSRKLAHEKEASISSTTAGSGDDGVFAVRAPGGCRVRVAAVANGVVTQ